MKRPYKGNRPSGTSENKNATEGAAKPKRRFGETPNFVRADAPKKTYKPRGDKPSYAPRADRAEGSERSFGSDKPKRPYTPRAEGAERPARPFGAKPYTPRGDRPEGDRPKRPYTPRTSGADRGDKPYAARGPYKPREERADGDRPKRPYTPRTEGGSRPPKPFGAKPYAPRGDRPDGDRPKRPYTPRTEGGERPARNFKPRGDFERPHRDKPFAARQAKPRDGWSPVESDKPRTPKPPREALHEDWIWGTHAVVAALANPQRGAPLRLVATEEAAKSLPDHVTAEVLERDIIDRLLPRSAVHQGLAVRFAPLEGVELETLAAPASGILLMLDQVTDPHNIGAVFRSAAAFGVKGVIVQDRHMPQLVGALAKAAVGTIETVPHARVVNLSRALEQLRESGWRIVGLAGEAETTLASALDARPTVLVLGSEGEGLRRLVAEHCDTLAHIPMSGGTESLNVSVAAGIALYAARAAAAV